MATEETPGERSGPGEVHITVVVVPGRLQAMLTKLRAGARVRTGLASVGVLAAVAASAIIGLSSSSGHATRPRDSNAMATQLRSGGQATSIMHRSDGGWVHEFEISNSTCPAARLPYRIAIGLHFCGPNLASPRAVASPSPRSR